MLVNIKEKLEMIEKFLKVNNNAAVNEEQSDDEDRLAELLPLQSIKDFDDMERLLAQDKTVATKKLVSTFFYQSYCLSYMATDFIAG